MKKCKVLQITGINRSRNKISEGGSLDNGFFPSVLDFPKIEEEIEKYLNQGWEVKSFLFYSGDSVMVYLEKNV